MAVRSQEIARILQQQISGQDLSTDTQNVGQVIEVGDGIARIWGLSDAVAGELLEFPGVPGEPAVMGLALNLEEETVGCRHPRAVHPDPGRQRGPPDGAVSPRCPLAMR